MLLNLAELRAKRDHYDKLISEYNLEDVWRKSLSRMTIDADNCDFIYDGDNELEAIRLPSYYSLYSWHLPKANFTIGESDGKIVIHIRDDNKTIQQQKGYTS